MIAFTASEYQADGSVRQTAYAFHGSPDDGWEIVRDGKLHLGVGRGFRALRVSHCGVCATDLARRQLPFPLPQVTGHEVVALDDHGRAVVVEINASHAARGLRDRGWCPHCTSGLATHCPERRVLGIHDLPGGFGGWVLAPVDGVVPVPAGVEPLTATFAEPFAAALHAVTSLSPLDGERVAVVGPRRLGGLVIAALAAWRAATRRRFAIVAVVRRADAGVVARALGADDVMDVRDAQRAPDSVEVAIDTSGTPDGTALAVSLATRDIHVKSTSGTPALGLAHATALVVDELTLVPWDRELVPRRGLPSPAGRTAAVVGDVPAEVRRALERRGLSVVAGDDPSALAAGLARDPQVPLGGADVALVTSLAAVDAAIRPRRGVEHGLVRARGTIGVVDVGQPRDGLIGAILGKGLRLTASRCGDLRQAVAYLAAHPSLGARLVTAVVPAERLATALGSAASPASWKVVVSHPGGLVHADRGSADA
jgi:threonine dehydrogenase-like Zn-dependent dehydrogenase